MLASALASRGLSIESIALRRREQPAETQQVLEEALAKCHFESQAYQEALRVFQNWFLYRADLLPAELTAGLKNLSEDTTVCGTI